MRKYNWKSNKYIKKFLELNFFVILQDFWIQTKLLNSTDTKKYSFSRGKHILIILLRTQEQQIINLLINNFELKENCKKIVIVFKRSMWWNKEYKTYQQSTFLSIIWIAFCFQSILKISLFHSLKYLLHFHWE